MPAPSTPTNFFVMTGNAQNLAVWDVTSGATSYVVQRSLDNVTFSTVATISGTPLATQYLDTAVTVGTQYWYQVNATNGSGSSAYTTAASAIPSITGELPLAMLRLQAQQRADRVNSNFVTRPEWNTYINQSMLELYDLLITAYEDYFIAPAARFTTDGSTFLYPLPDGVTSFTNAAGSSFVPAPFYKLRGVDLGVANASNAFVTLQRFNFGKRNQYLYPNSASTIYGVFNMRYKLLGSKIEFIPTPSANQVIQLWYIPRLSLLLQDTDITTVGISGWTEYIIVDAAIKALQKEEADVSTLLAQKAALKQRIEESAMNRDDANPETILDSRGDGWGGNGASGFFGPVGGY